MEGNTYRYYCLYRQPDIGSVPQGFCKQVCFEGRPFVPEINHNAWGYVEYKEPLAPIDVINYELAADPKNDLMNQPAHGKCNGDYCEL
jgi:hypothetical protein